MSTPNRGHNFISVTTQQTVMHIGENIRKIREWKGYRREYVAEQLDMHLTSYGNIERGQTDLTVRRLLQIAEVLRVPPGLLLTEAAGDTPPGYGNTPLTESLLLLNEALQQLRKKTEP